MKVLAYYSLRLRTALRTITGNISCVLILIFASLP